MTKLSIGNTHPLLRRLLSGTVVNVYGQFVTAILQLMTVPILVSIWGIQYYGQWVMLYTIPTYLILSDLGFSSAAMADISWKLGQGDAIGARATYHSSKILSLGITGLLTSVALTIWLSSPFFYPADDFVGPRSGLAVASIVFYSALLLQKTFTLSGLRASGNFAAGMLLDYTVNLFDGICIIVAAKYGADLSGCIQAAVVSRLCGNVVTWALLHTREPTLEKGYSGASMQEIRRLFAPAIAIGMLPLGLAISMQGATLLVGALISPAAAAVFGATRTVCRITAQVATVVNRASVPEMAFALGGDRERHVAAILIVNAAVAVFGVLPATLFLSLFGNEIISLWTFGKITPTRSLVILLSVGTLFHACWWLIANLLTAVRLQLKFSHHFLALSILALAISVPVTKSVGVSGMAFILLLLDIAMFARVTHVLIEADFFNLQIMSSQLATMKHRFFALGGK